jgi:putative transposase
MPRPPRFTYAHAVHHVTLRCNNREFLFSDPAFEAFVDLLRQARGRFPLSLYSYCLMTNHVHLLFRVGADDTLSKVMHWLSTSFTRWFNKLAGRNGHVWEGRFRSTLIEAESYLFRCMAYVALNPVRAGMVADPLAYPWSGHPAICEEDVEQVDLSPEYLDCGADATARSRFYQRIVADEALRPAASLARVHFVGGPRFVRRMETRFGLNRPDALLRRQAAGSGIVFVGPRHGKGHSRPK